MTDRFNIAHTEPESARAARAARLRDGQRIARGAATRTAAPSPASPARDALCKEGV